MTTTIPRETSGGEANDASLAPELLVRMHETMVRARCLEERLIRMNKQGDGYFWIGGPGEEAFNVPLGLLVNKGQGPAYDYLHLHYRSSATLLAMGADPVDALRQMKSTANDPYSGGRNFCNHYSVRKWNVVPVSSPIEVQFSMAPGTAMAKKRAGGKGITIVQGGDAGTAEGDFATCLIWCSRPGNELPLPHDRHEQPLGHLHAGRRAARREAHRPTAASPSASRPRSSTATIRRSRTAS